MHCVGVILAGGGATRCGGEPKGLRLVEGTRIIDRVAAALRGVADELLLIANDPAADTWLPGVRTAADVRRGDGALGGLHAALSHAGGHAVLVVAWDMPFASEGLLRALRAAGEQGYDAVVPESETSGRGVEPLCACIARRACPPSSGASTPGTAASCRSSTPCACRVSPLPRCRSTAIPRASFST